TPIGPRVEGHATMGSSKRKSRQLSEPVEEPFYSIRGILKENKMQYLVDWEDVDDHKFEPTWEPKGNVTEAAIQEWEDKKQQALNEERKRKRKSTDRPASPREVIQIDDDDDEQSEDEQRPSKRTTASSSKPPLSKRKSNAAVEISPPAKQLPVVGKRKPGRPRKEAQDVQSRAAEDEDEMPSKLPPRPRGRPRKSLPGPDVVRKAKEQDENGENTDQQSARLGRS
ncbi:hypothetical protein KCU67_g16342, partial [Aureobasidium melanogenum]